MNQQHFGGPAGRTSAEQARVTNAGGVEDEEVAGWDEGGQVGEVAVMKALGFGPWARSVDHQQPARSALRRRHLRDQVFGKRVVEISRGPAPFTHRAARPGCRSGGWE